MLWFHKIPTLPLHGLSLENMEGVGVVGGNPVGWKCFNTTHPWLGMDFFRKPHSRLQVLLLIKLTSVSMIASCFQLHFSVN